MAPHRIFLLSPASASGRRSQLLLARSARFELALRLREAGAPIGEVFGFVSSLYFRGKLSYAERFSSAPDAQPGVLVITADRGLVGPHTLISVRDMRGFARVPIDAKSQRFTQPLAESARELRARLPLDAEVVLLGSVATSKYTEVLLEVFGAALHFPGDFVGRGDMSRGGLLLRAVRSGTELGYQRVEVSVRRGARAPRLESSASPRAGVRRSATLDSRGDPLISAP